MTWLQLRLEGRRDTVADLEDLLLSTGSVAVTLQDNADEPVLEPAVGETPLWQSVRLTGLYRADADMAQVLAQFPDGVLDKTRHRIEILEDRDWEREWMQHYQPVQFGARLWVCPSWLEPPEPDAVNLLLDPGLAFGTGTHPTTALCLGELDRLALDGGRVDGARLTGARVVDYGCGSGILALAALKLGAVEALGVDNDPQALAASRDNAQRNAIADTRLSLSLPDLNNEAPFCGTADLVIANILAGPLLDLRDRLTGFMKPGSVLLLSGLLETQATEVCNHYASVIGLSVASTREGWVCLKGEINH